MEHRAQGVVGDARHAEVPARAQPEARHERAWHDAHLRAEVVREVLGVAGKRLAAHLHAGAHAREPAGHVVATPRAPDVRRQHERRAVQVAQAYLGQVVQAAVLAYEQQHLLVGQGEAPARVVEARLAGRVHVRLVSHDDDVVLARLERVEGGRGPLVQRELDACLGVPALDGAPGLVHEPLDPGEVRGCHAHHEEVVGQRAIARARVLPGGKRVARRLHEPPALAREPHVAAVAGHELAAELLLERADVPGQRGARHEEPLGRLRVAQHVGEHEELLQVTCVHGLPQPLVRPDPVLRAKCKRKYTPCEAGRAPRAANRPRAKKRLRRRAPARAYPGRQRLHGGGALKGDVQWS